MNTHHNPSHTRPLIAAAVLTLLVALAFAVDLSPWLRGGYGWRWPYVPAALIQLLPLALTLIAYCIGAALLWHLRPRWLILWSMAGTLAIVLASIAAREPDVPYALFARAASKLGTGPHWVSTHIDWASGAWRDWGATVASFGGHMSNLPPGSILWYALMSSTLDQVPALAHPVYEALLPYQCHNYDLLTYTPGQWASTLFGMAMPLWAALTPLPLYGVARRTASKHARHVVLAYPLIPALSAFAGSWNTIYPLIALLALLTLMIGCARPRWRVAWCFISGLITGLGWFINIALVPLGLFLGLWVLVHEWIAQRRPLIQCVGIGAAFSVGLVIPWGIFWLISGQTPLDLLRAGMAFHLTLDRPYAFWVGMHLWDWLYWGGLAFALVMLFPLAAWVRRGVRNREALPVMSVTLALTMLILIFSGTARGETGRVWLFFSPFLILAASEYRRDDAAPISRAGWLTVMGAQGIFLTALVYAIPATSTDFTPAPQPQAQALTRPADALFSDTTGGAEFRLSAWDATLTDDALLLALNWQGVNHAASPHWFGVTLIAPDGTVTGSEPWQPTLSDGQRYPTTCWRAGVTLTDTVRIPLPEDAPAGEYWLSLAAFGQNDQPEGRLSVIQGGETDTQIGLGPITR